MSTNEQHPTVGGEDLLIGTRLDDFQIIRLIGRGGMARVYEGRDVKLDRPVALKIMSAEYLDDEEMKSRFFREARAVANLDHPNIVAVYRFGEGPRMYYIAMKLLEGKTLLSVLKQLRQQKRFLESEKALRIVTDIAAALDYAHSRGVIHRDIKPSNIMLTNDGHAVLMDFGLLMEADRESTLGTAFGTPRYISPEQAMASHRAVPQSDIYSLGVVLYEILTGQAPFDTGSPMNLALSHINNPPPQPRALRPDLPVAVEGVLLRTLEKSPELRWQTGREFVQALRTAFDMDSAAQSKDLMPSSVQPDGNITSATPPSIALGQAASQDSGPLGSTYKSEPVASSALPRDEHDPTQLLPRPASTPRASTGIFGGFTRRDVVVIGAVALVLLCTGALALASVIPQFSAIKLGASTTTPGPLPDIRLIYSSDMFTVYNASGRLISLEGVSFARPDRTDRFRAKLWGDVAHTRLLPGHCLGIDPIDDLDDVFPDVCGLDVDRYETPAGLAGRFWIARSPAVTTFIVLRGEDPFHTCSTQTNACEFSLP